MDTKRDRYEYQKKYKEENKAYMKAYNKKYYQEHQEERIADWKENSKEYNVKKRLYYDKNRDLLLKKQAQIYQEKKENKIVCECGKHYIYTGKWQHVRSKQHMKYLSTS